MNNKLKINFSLTPPKLIIFIGVLLPFSFGFAKNIETKTATDSSNIKSKEQIILLKAGTVANEIYFARAHDNYYKIARKFGLSAKYLMSINNTKNPFLIIKAPVIIKSFIEPASTHNGLIINLPEKKLYHFSKGKLLKTYGVAVGQPTWQTPTGNFSILYKTEAPAWHIPVSIQKEMAAKGKPVTRTVVPAGPGNPLGNWWMAIANGIGIHSTNAPASIGYSVSHGCIRMKPKSAEELFKKVKVKTPVKVIYQPVKIGTDKKNNVYLEVYGDMYSRNFNYQKTTNMLLKQSNLDRNISWETVSRVLIAKQGIPVLISKVLSTTIPVITPTTVPTVKPKAKTTAEPSVRPTSNPGSLQPTVNPGDINPYVSPTEKPIDIIPVVRPKVTVAPIASPTAVTIPPTVKPTETTIILPTAAPKENMLDTTHPR